jgi:hypothetical protein
VVATATVTIADDDVAPPPPVASVVSIADATSPKQPAPTRPPSR